MKLEYILAVAVRLFALAIAYEAFKSLIGLFAFYDQIETPSAIGVYLLSFLVLFFVSVVLWKFPSLIARKITNFPTISNEEIDSQDSDQYLQIGLSILGVYLLYYVISDFASWGYYLLSISRNPGYELVLNPQQEADVFATFVELAIALPLILGAKKITKIIKKLRYS